MPIGHVWPCHLSPGDSTYWHCSGHWGRLVTALQRDWWCHSGSVLRWWQGGRAPCLGTAMLC